MPRVLFWGGLAVALAGLGLAIALAGLDAALYPGLLALFAFVTGWTTASFQLWARSSAIARENADLMSIGSETLAFAGADNTKGVAHLITELLLANPGQLFVAIDDVQHKLKGGEVMSESAYGVCLHPRLSGSMPESNQPKVDLPIPVFPGGLSKLRVTVHVSTDDIKVMQSPQWVEIRYHAAGYPAKTLPIELDLRKP